MKSSEEGRILQEIIADTDKIVPACSREGGARYTVLVENKVKPGVEGLTARHGLALLLEKAGKYYLLDTGTGAETLKNADVLGKDMQKVEAVFVSHGHYDHGGGLSSFLKANRTAKIFLSEAALREKHLAQNPGAEAKDISLDATLADRYPERFVFTETVTAIDEGLTVLPVPDRVFPLPAGNNTLYRQDGGEPVRDDFLHERILVSEEEDGLVVFSGCCHSGILNVLHTVRRHYPSLPLKAVLGGFHLYNPDLKKLSEPKTEVTALGRKLAAAAAGRYFTCHCTGLEAYTLLKRELGDRLGYLYTGLEFTL